MPHRLKANATFRLEGVPEGEIARLVELFTDGGLDTQKTDPPGKDGSVLELYGPCEVIGAVLDGLQGLELKELAISVRIAADGEFFPNELVRVLTKRFGVHVLGVKTTEDEGYTHAEFTISNHRPDQIEKAVEFVWGFHGVTNVDENLGRT